MKKSIHKPIYISFIVLLSLITIKTNCLKAQEANAYDAEKVYQEPGDPLVRAKIAHWQDLKFGLFMHWGTYSEWGVVESWTLCPEDWDFTHRKGPYAKNWFSYKKAYENLQTTFNPSRFHPEKWAAAAKAAGMKYMVFTTKHHDGFSMFDTKYTDYKVTDPKTPFSSNPKSNVTKEIFNAFRAQDFMVGAYFSKPDWHSEDYWWSYFPPKDRNESYDRKRYPERWKRFTDFTYNQLQELMTGYGPVDIAWFDGDWARMDIQPIVTMARKNQPGIIIVDRRGAPENVNYLTPEQKIPEHYIPHPWETCLTMGKSWSYIPDEVYKPSRELIQTLVEIVAKNGNLLLDIGPGPDGEWHQEAYDRLKEISNWIKINGESIYGTKPLFPYHINQWAFTQKGNIYYATYLPGAQESVLPAKLLLPLKPNSKNVKIHLLGNKEELYWKLSGKQMEIILPPAAIRRSAGQAAWVFKMN